VEKQFEHILRAIIKYNAERGYATRGHKVQEPAGKILKKNRHRCQLEHQSRLFRNISPSNFQESNQANFRYFQVEQFYATGKACSCKIT
jgi:hypothetical protein